MIAAQIAVIRDVVFKGPGLHFAVDDGVFHSLCRSGRGSYFTAPGRQKTVSAGEAVLGAQGTFRR